MNLKIYVLFTVSTLLVSGIAATSLPASGDMRKTASGYATAGNSLQAVPDNAFDCLIEPMSLIELGGSTQGVVEHILVERGERVKKDQVIIELESSVEKAYIEQAEVRARMESEIQAREAEYVLAKLEYARFDEMHKRDLAPEQQRDEAAARLRIAAAAVVQADDNRRLLQLELERLRRELAKRSLKSPVDGIVVDHFVSVGETVRDDPVTRIAQLHPLRVEAVLPGRFFGSLKRGDGARVFPEFNDGAPLSTTINVVDPMLDAQSGTFGVGLTLANADFSIAGGQRCRIVFDDAPPIAAATVRTHENADDLSAGSSDVYQASGNVAK